LHAALRCRFVAYFLRCVEVLQRAGVQPLCVFDGGPLPSKAGEEAERERCAQNRSGAARRAATGCGPRARR
jgi:exonuclease-1